MVTGHSARGVFASCVMKLKSPKTASPGKKRGARRRSAEGPPNGVVPAQPIPRPALPRSDLLPVHAVGSVNFEYLCRDLVVEMFPGEVVRASLKRKKGVAQFGVDVEGFDADGEPTVVVSAKCYERIKPSHLNGWLKEFTDHLDTHWQGRRIRRFVLAVSIQTNDDAINEAIRSCIRTLKPLGIEFLVWNVDLITSRLRRSRHLVDRYFN